MTESTQFADLYEVLKIGADATDDEIRTAIRQVRREWSRRQGNPDVEIRGRAERALVAIAAAESTLTEPERRAAYDAQRLQQPAGRLDGGTPPSAAASAGKSSPGGSAVDPPSSTPAPPIDNWLAQARSAGEIENWSGCRYFARRALDLDQNRGEAWLLAARSSLMMGETGDAFQEAQRAAHLQPRDVESLLLLGTVQLELRRHDAARATFDRVNALAPMDSRADVGVARIMTETGYHREAVTVLERSLASHPGDQALGELLASALSTTAMTALSVGVQGEPLVTNVNQADSLGRTVEQLRSLTVTNPYIQARIGELQFLRDQSLTTQHHRSENFKWYAIAFGLSLFGLLSGFGNGSAGTVLFFLTIAVLIGFVYHRRHFIPLWKHQRRVQPVHVLRSGLQ